MVYDIAIIGAGVVGTQVARTLSKYNLKTVLVEKTSDIAMGTTKANSGIVHAGFDAQTGSLMAKLNVKGCQMMEEVCKTLFVPYENNGSLVVAFSEEEMATIKDLYDRGIANGIAAEDLEIIDRDRLVELEPNIGPTAVGALHAKSAGIVSPYELAIAAAECAVSNGVEFVRNFEVADIAEADGVFTLKAADGKTIETSIVINVAGLYADVLATMYDESYSKYKIIPRLGEYGLLDRNCAGLCTHTIFQCPSKMGKGILVSPTTHHNILVGPTSVDIEDKDDLSVRVGALRNTYAIAQKSIPAATARDQITSFAGLRAHLDVHDFIIEKSGKNDHFINAIGIESPGLASSPAIAEFIEELVLSVIGPQEEKADWNPSRKAPVFFRNLSFEEQEELIAKDPAYARIICRCETITEGEIRDAVRAPAGAIDVDGVKRRTRAGMGRCQGGFCGSKVMEIIADELNVDIDTISKFGGNSDIIYERTK